MLQHFQKAKNTVKHGALYVLATPIGNLADISLRALAVLETADILCAEDTRVTAQLLAAYGIGAKHLVSVREHNEAAMAEKITAWLAEGKSVAQVSDAGTPAVCDPGARLVAAVRAAGFAVIPVPGACAAVAALSAAGLAGEDFYFAGFLPAKKSGRRARLAEICALPCAAVMYETPHRIRETLADFLEITAPQRPLVLARELTKTFETILSGSLQDIAAQLAEDADQTRGEMVLVLPAQKLQAAGGENSADTQKLLHALAKHLSTKQAAEIAQEVLGGGKRQWYESILQLKETPH